MRKAFDGHVSNILFADDNPHAQRMGSQILSQEGHTVVAVSDGDEAMQYLGENQPDLVMVDTRMPGPSGFEICKYIKSNPALGAIKVVLLAGPLEPFDTSEAESAGPDGVLHKPLDAYTLIETVNSLLGKVEETADGEEQPAGVEPASAGDSALQALAGNLTAQQPAAKPEAKRAAIAVATEDAPAEDLTLDLSDQFASVVEQALGTGDSGAQKRERIRQAVRETMEASLPALIELITERVMQSLDHE